MIDIKSLEKDTQFKQRYFNSLKARGERPALIEETLELNQLRKKLIMEEQNLIAQRKAAEKSAEGLKANSLEESLKKEKFIHARKIGEQISALNKKLNLTEKKISDILLQLPNLCHESVPPGSSSLQNEELRRVGRPREFSFSPRSHLDLAGRGIDTERAAKVAGARFTFLRGAVAKLERALSAYMLDVHTKTNGYEELQTPFIVNEKSLIHTGQLPKFKKDLFLLGERGDYLLPTAEVSLTNFFSNEILSEKDLPLKFVSCTPCFRAEAGSYGKDTRGLIRQHQFMKVELVAFCHPENSYQELENLTAHAEMILQGLELPYRVVSLCAGDMGFSAAKCYDLEVWLPSENTYREISSCSNCEDYQARRAKIRFRSHRKDSSDSKIQFAHTLNGSGLAVGRTLTALLENHQNEDGSVRLPPVLRSYMDGENLILKP